MPQIEVRESALTVGRYHALNNFAGLSIPGRLANRVEPRGMHHFWIS